MKSNLSQNLALKLVSNENYLTEELLGISWIEFKFFTSSWKRFDLYFPLLKPKKGFFFFLNEIKSQSKFGLEVSFQWKLLHWGTVRYLMNGIQVVYFKLKEIWPLFSPAKAKKPSSFFTSLPPKYESMKPNLSQKVTKVNFFTEELNSSCLFQTERDLTSIFHC